MTSHLLQPEVDQLPAELGKHAFSSDTPQEGHGDVSLREFKNKNKRSYSGDGDERPKRPKSDSTDDSSYKDIQDKKALHAQAQDSVLRETRKAAAQPELGRGVEPEDEPPKGHGDVSLRESKNKNKRSYSGDGDERPKRPKSDFTDDSSYKDIQDKKALHAQAQDSDLWETRKAAVQPEVRRGFELDNEELPWGGEDGRSEPEVAVRGCEEEGQPSGRGLKEMLHFLKEFETLKDGSAVILPEVLKKGAFSLGEPFPEHEVKKLFKKHVQLRTAGEFNYILKKVLWNKEQLSSLLFQLELARISGIIKTQGMIKFGTGDASKIGIMLEYAAGGSLDEVIKRPDWNISSAVKCFRKIVNSIVEIEQQNVIFTDMKPENFALLRKDDPSSVVAIDLESFIDLASVSRTTKPLTTTIFAPSLELSFGDRTIQKGQKLEWHRWCFGLIISSLLPPYNLPWSHKMKEFGKDSLKMKKWIMRNPRDVEQCLPKQNAPSDQWKDKQKSYTQLWLMIRGLLGLDSTLFPEKCLEFAVFSGKEKCPLHLEDGESKVLLDIVQVDPGTTVKDNYAEISQILWKRFPKGFRMEKGGASFCFGKEETMIFKNETLAVFPPHIEKAP